MKQTLKRDSSDNEFLSSDSEIIPTTSESSIPFSKARRVRRLIDCLYPDCGLSFRRRDAFDRHEYIHNGIKKYSCENCDSKYITVSHLKRHSKNSHQIQSDTKIPCQHESCAMEFSSTSNMKRHFRQRHLKEKLYSCKVCDEKFYRKMQLRIHSVKHTGVFPYLCDKCGQGSTNLKAHEHHLISHKTYKCADCGEVLSKWSLLLVHRREVHIKKHQCEICKAIFSHKSNLDSHMRIHSENKTVFPCDVNGCHKFYFHSKNLRAHVRAKHDPDRIWECFQCCRQFSTKQKIILHLKVHDMHKQKIFRLKCKSIAKERPSKLRKKRGVNSIKYKSTAACLTGVIVDPNVDKMVINGDGNSLQIFHNIVESSV